MVLDVLLEIAVGRAAGHRPDGAHRRGSLVGAPLEKERLARCFLGPGEQRPDHHQRAPAASALAISPLVRMPPSAITGTPPAAPRLP